MSRRNVALSPRVEDTRDKQSSNVVSFSLTEIKEHFDQNIAAIHNQFDVAHSLRDSGREVDEKNIYRSQIVFLESALDFYLHELNKYGLRQIFDGNWEKTDRYNNLKIPMKHFEEGLREHESSEWFLQYVNDAYSRDVFTSYISMNDQMNTLGLNITDLCKDIFPPSSDPAVPSKTAKSVIMDLFNRRNQIAHQTDRAHADAVQTDIAEAYVLLCISDVETIVATLHNAAMRKG